MLNLTTATADEEFDLHRDDMLNSYLEWLHYEAELLRIELYGEAAPNWTPVGTFAKSFHFPHPPQSWKDLPQPSTRAEMVLKAVGVKIPPQPAEAAS